jgi:hypothetical protein
MNLKNRLKKLENEAINDSTICNCQKELKIKIVTCPEDTLEISNFCETCQKPKAEPFRFTLNLNPNGNLNGEINK